MTRRLTFLLLSICVTLMACGTTDSGTDAGSSDAAAETNEVSESDAGGTTDGGEGDVPISCVPDAERACQCDNGDDGVQHCNDEGDGYGPCYCTSSSTSGDAGGEGDI